MSNTHIKDLDGIIAMYDNTVKNMEEDAKNAINRTYGGYLRSTKGELVEDVTESLIRIAWTEVGGKADDISISKNKVPIPIKQEYVDRMDNSLTRDYIFNNLDKHHYRLSVDKHVYIRNKFVMGVECKSYAENAMLKRICIDFWFLTQHFPKLSCVLLQFESQLGGDYSKGSEPKQGSRSTHSIMSHFPIDLEIITLLEGERNIDKPVHKFYKPIKREALEYALEKFKARLKPFVS